MSGTKLAVFCLVLAAGILPAVSVSAAEPYTGSYTMWSRPCAGTLYVNAKRLTYYDAPQIEWMKGVCIKVPYKLLETDGQTFWTLQLGGSRCPYKQLKITLPIEQPGLLQIETRDKDGQQMFACPATKP